MAKIEQKLMKFSYSKMNCIRVCIMSEKRIIIKRGHKNIAIITLEGDIVAPGKANFRSIGYKIALDEYGVTTPIAIP